MPTGIYARYPKSPKERFLAKITKTKTCWLWKESKGRYAHFRLFGKPVRINRAAYILFIGPIPEGYEVCHTCDNTKCVRPSHLFLGTHLDNMVDMVNKSRAVGHVGENNPNAKLSKEDIIVIRTLLNIGKKPRHILPLFAISRTQ